MCFLLNFLMTPLKKPPVFYKVEVHTKVIIKHC